MVDQAADASERKAISLSIAVSLGLGILLTWPSWSAQFGAIDDHEPLRWMGRDNRLGVHEAWSTFRGTEVGQWGETGRWRPAYYAVRVAETVAFGDHQRLWYASVLAMFVTTCTAFGYAVSLWFERYRPPVAVAATFAMAGARTWAGVLGRLGPSEQVALLAVAVMLLAVTKRAVGGRSYWWAVAVAAFAIAVWSKETFISFCVPAAIVGTWLYAKHRDRIDLVGGLATLAPAVVLAVVLAPHVRRGDVYGRSTGGDRIADGLAAMDGPVFRLWFITTACLAVTVVALSRSMLERDRLALFGLLAWSVAAVPLDAVFNVGDYWAPRYRAVIDLVVLLQTFGLAALAARYAGGVARVATAVAALTVATASVVNLVATHDRVTTAAEQTRRFDRAVAATVAQIEQHSDTPVAVVVQGDTNYEIAAAASQELWRRSSTPPVRQFLLPLADSPALWQIADSGRADWHIRPWNELLDGDDKAICLIINGPKVVDRCNSSLSTSTTVMGM